MNNGLSVHKDLDGKMYIRAYGQVIYLREWDLHVKSGTAGMVYGLTSAEVQWVRDKIASIWLAGTK